jgi:hypothetical protein
VAGRADVAGVDLFTEDSTAPMTVVKPSGFTVSQILVFIIAHDASNNLAALTAQAGWAEEGNYSGTGGQAKVWSHVYDGNEPSSWDFGYDSGSGAAAILFRITEADLTPYITVTSQAFNSNGSSEDSPTIIPYSGNDLLLCTLSLAGGGNVLSETDPSGMSDDGQVQFLSLFMAMAGAHELLTNSAATGVRTWTSISPTAKAGGTFSVAVKSAADFDPDPPPSPSSQPIAPPWLLRELLIESQRIYIANNLAPFIVDRQFGGASGADVTLNTQVLDVNDLLVLFHGNNFNTAANLPAPTGTYSDWTLEATGDNGTNSVHLKVWTHLVTTPGVQQVIAGRSPSDEEITAQLFAIRNVDFNDPVDAAAGNNGSASTNHIAPSISPVTTNALLLAGTQTGTVSNYTAPSGPPDANKMQFEMEVDVAPFMTAATASAVLGIDGATGTRTFVSSANDIFATASIAIKALPVEGTGPTTFNVTQDDDVGLTDSTVLDEFYVFTDSAGLTDTIAITQSIVIDDSVGLTDSATEELFKLITVSDDVGLTDTFALTESLAVTDSAGLTDTTAITQSKIFTDSAGLTDTSTQELIKLVVATDSTGLTDTFALTQSKVFTDSSGLTDTNALTQGKVFTDSSGLTDNAVLELVKLVTQTDSVGLTDTNSILQSKIISDLIGLTDTTAFNQTKVVTDSAGLTDTSSVGLLKAVTQTDSVGLTDNQTLLRIVVFTDDSGLTDSSAIQLISISGGPDLNPIIISFRETPRSVHWVEHAVEWIERGQLVSYRERPLR